MLFGVLRKGILWLCIDLWLVFVKLKIVVNVYVFYVLEFWNVVIIVVVCEVNEFVFFV